MINSFSTCGHVPLTTDKKALSENFIFFYFFSLSFVMILSGIEDQDNWHGKPLGAKTEASVQAIMENIANKGKHQLCPKAPGKDLPVVPFGGVKLSEPPSYKLGEMVLYIIV